MGLVNIKKVKNILKNPYLIFNKIAKYGLLNFLPDRLFLKIKYRLMTKEKLNLDAPKKYNEKVQWLKLYDRKDIYTTMVDKYEAKKYVASIIGEEYIIPTYGIYEKFEDIDFNLLPNQFVIKCTHDSGGLAICKDKSTFDIVKAKKKINNSLKKNYFYEGREWVYKNIKPRIIIEKYMEDKNSSTMQDYKFFCFDGVPKIMYLSEGLENHATATMSFFDMNFKLTDCKRKDYKLFDYNPKKPKNFDKMKEFSAILSKDIPHLRVDFYEINGHLYFGELTFFTCSGMIPFENEAWNIKMGAWINLPNQKQVK